MIEYSTGSHPQTPDRVIQIAWLVTFLFFVAVIWTAIVSDEKCYNPATDKTFVCETEGN